MGAPERVGDRPGRQVSVDACDRRRHASDLGHGARTHAQQLHRPVADPHAARARRTVGDIDVLERSVTEQHDDRRPQRGIGTLQGRLEARPLHGRAEHAGERRERVWCREGRPRPGPDVEGRAGVPRATLGGLQRHRLRPR